MKIHFDTSFDVDVPEETGSKVVELLENYIITISKLIPGASAIDAGVGDRANEKRTA